MLDGGLRLRHDKCSALKQRLRRPPRLTTRYSANWRGARRTSGPSRTSALQTRKASDPIACIWNYCRSELPASYHATHQRFARHHPVEVPEEPCGSCGRSTRRAGEREVRGRTRCPTSSCSRHPGHIDDVPFPTPPHEPQHNAQASSQSIFLFRLTQMLAISFARILRQMKASTTGATRPKAVVDAQIPCDLIIACMASGAISRPPGHVHAPFSTNTREKSAGSERQAKMPALGEWMNASRSTVPAIPSTNRKRSLKNGRAWTAVTRHGAITSPSLRAGRSVR